MPQMMCAYEGRFGRLFSVTSSGKLVAHAHREWQLVFNVKGPRANFFIGNVSAPISEGQVLAIPPWCVHSKVPSRKGPSSMVSLLIAAPWLRLLQANEVVSLDLPSMPWRASVSNQVRGLLTDVCAAAFESADASLPHFELDVGRILSLTLSQGRERASCGFHPTLRRMDHRIRKALDIIQIRKGRKISLDTVAETVALSRPHFFKLFKDCVGTSPLHVVDCSRMEAAVRMLGETDKPIAQLAHALGFSTQGHFTRFFVRHLFIPPSSYRAKLRIERSVQLHDEIGCRKHDDRIDLAAAGSST
jgi:AraC family transcriptional regulator